MNTSPLGFAKKFSRLKSDLNSPQSDDNRLLLLQAFWKEECSLLNDKSYQSYFDEFKELFTLFIKEENVIDLTIEELQSILELSQSLNLSDASKIIVTRLVKLLCYVGELKDALTTCQELTGKDIDPSEIPEDLFGQSGIEPLREICHHLKRLNSKSCEIFQTALSDWEQVSASLHNDKAVALFVEKDSNGSALRGRMRILKGTVELFGKSARNDELTFDNQLKAPNDPFVGVVYNSFKAVRNVFKSAGYKKQGSNFYHVHYSVENSSHTFTGDSIGLAAGLVAYTQLLKPEVVRHERFLSGEVAFTGGVDENGKLTPVNNDTLSAKIKRAFFSPMKYLVLPESNATVAREHLNKLNKQYPRRRLHLVSAEYLPDVIENLNIVRAEKVCPGKVAIKIVTKYSRMTKVQVPLLIVLSFIFVQLLLNQFPKLSPLFDDNPQYVKLTKSGFEALNIDSIPLWSVEYECESIDDSNSKWEIGDIDGDGMNEVGFIPMASYHSPCENNAFLFVYTYNGDELFNRYCGIIGEYPGDTSQAFPYAPQSVEFFKYRDSVIIVTKVFCSYPSRTHIKFWNTDGDLISWYINAGSVGIQMEQFAYKSDICLVFIGDNRRMKSACLFILDPFSSTGVSPPYEDPYYDLKKCKRGNQLCYIIFPPSDVNIAFNKLYNGADQLVFESDKVINVNINESESKSEAGKTFSSILQYKLNIEDNFRIIKVYSPDAFIQTRDSLVADKKLPEIDWKTYRNNLLNAVTYWTDSGWVTEGELRAAEK